MVEGHGFDVFLNSWTQLALITPAFDTKLLWDDGIEKSVDLIEASLIFLGNFGRERLIGCADSLESEYAGCC